MELIISLPLSIRDVRGFLIWHFGKKGIFPVNLAYHFARNLLLPPSIIASSLSQSPILKLWTVIWKANVLPKVRLFTRRLCRDLLLMRLNLVKKRIATELSCVLCNSTAEFACHIFRDCHYAWCSWICSPIGVPLRSLDPMSTSVWFFKITDTLSPTNLSCDMMIYWTIWNSRNSMLRNDKCDAPNLAVTRAICW
ncbi:hypothetical protein ACFX2A_000184 [Malus domestica]